MSYLGLSLLHILNYEMVALLKSGRINNRLLCELATHKDFIKFLADIEIYVDGIATCLLYTSVGLTLTKDFVAVHAPVDLNQQEARPAIGFADYKAGFEQFQHDEADVYKRQTTTTAERSSPAYETKRSRSTSTSAA